MINKFEKDMHSKAVLNINRASYEEYKNKRDDTKKVCSLEKKLECLGSEMRELKDLINKIFKGK
jgi:DNA polymerase elongation subunit (family B)